MGSYSGFCNVPPIFSSEHSSPLVATEWKAFPPAASPEFIVRNSDAIGALPQLPRGGCPFVRPPNGAYGLFTAPKVPKYAFEERQAAYEDRSAGVEPACNRPRREAPPANSAERRLHQRYMERRAADGFRANRRHSGRRQSRRQPGGRTAVKVCFSSFVHFSLFTAAGIKSMRR